VTGFRVKAMAKYKNWPHAGCFAEFCESERRSWMRQLSYIWLRLLVSQSELA
jgi:hypothetical protein